MIICRTPFRISFIGGGTDYPAWYRTHGGEVLAVTIDKYCYLTCRYLPPFFEHRIRLVYSKIEMCKTVEEILAEDAKAIPMGRLGRPDEVAAMVHWLASDECSFSTGAVFDLSGGRATY